MATLPGQANSFMSSLDNWLWLLTLDGRWRYWLLMLLSPWNEVRINNLVKAGYIFSCCITLVPSLTLLDDLAALSLIAVLLCRLVSKQGEEFGDMAAIDISSGPCKDIWVAETAWTPDVFWYHLYVFHIAPLYSFEHVPSQTTHVVRLLDFLG